MCIKYRLHQELNKIQRKMEFGKVIDEIKKEVLLLFSDKAVQGVDLHVKRDNLTYLVSEANSLGLKEKESAPAEFKTIIDRQLSQLNAYANKGFERLDFLIKGPSKVVPVEKPTVNPQPIDNQPLQKETGAVPKIRANAPVVPQIEVPQIQVPQFQIDTQRQFEQTNPFVEDASINDTSINEKPTYDENILNAIFGQIRSEFDRILVNNPILSAQSEMVGSPLKIDDDPNEMVQSTKKHTGIEYPEMQLKFDKVELSIFSGDYTEWISFRDEFLQLVHKNPKLSEVVKFHQLKTHLKGIALDAINGFKLSAADYDAAWQTLVQRYDNDYRIVTEYIKKFYQLPVLGPNPSNGQFLQMVNKTNQLIRVLPTFGYDVSSWDPILMYNLLARLDSRSIAKWNDQIKKRQKIPLSELMEFLEVQAAEIVAESTDRPRMAYQNPKNKFVRKENKRAHVMLTVNNEPSKPPLKCAQCGNNHLTFTCKTFRSLPVSDRIKKIKTAKHCLKCLNRHENGQQCNFGPCKYCSKDHNYYLCFQHEKEMREQSNKDHAVKSSDSQQKPEP